MAYRWGLEGPAFEFPTPYLFENRFLRLRGWALIALALLLVLVVLLVPPSHDGQGVSAEVVEIDVVPGSAVPHFLAAALLVAFGVLELVRAARQRNLLLAPGQPASLTSEVRREATGASSGANWLMQALGRGTVGPMETTGPYQGWLTALSPHLGAAPRTLVAYLQIRLAQLLGLGGLMLITAATWLIASRPPAQALTALACGGLGVMLIARSAQGPERAPLGPGLTGGVLALAVVLAPLAWFFAAIVPRSDSFGGLQLPVAALVLLAGAWLVDMLGLLAARAQIEPPPLGEGMAGEQSEVGASVDPAALMREIDLELHRRWTEGIPNRRHAWQPPEPRSESFNGLVLEESQPLPPPGAREMSWIASLTSPRSRWLWLLCSLGLLATLAGGAVWLALARAHMLDASASWSGAALGLALIIVGGHAHRVAHLLWSRVEADSVLTWLELSGTRAGPVLNIALRARVAQVHSLFYVGAPHQPGSRTMLHLQGDTAASRHWTQQVQVLARQLPPSPTGLEAVPAPQAAPGPTPPRPSRLRENATRGQEGEGTASSGTARAARFCQNCGTPLLQGARFCQNCGHNVQAG